MKALLSRLASRNTLIALLALMLIVWGGFEATIRSDWFKEKLRQRVVAELEQATGGAVQLAALDFDPSSMVIDLRGLTIRAPGVAEPFVNLPDSSVGLTVRSFLSLAVQLDSLVLREPTVRLEIAADGSTNWPERDPARTSSGLLELGIGRLEVSQGHFIFNGVPYSTDLEAESLGLEAVLDSEGCYALDFAIRSVDARVDEWTVDSGVDSESRLCAEQVQIVRADLTTADYGSWSVRGTAAGLSAPVLDLDAEFDAPLGIVAGQLPEGWGLLGSASGSVRVQGPFEDIAFLGEFETQGATLEGPASSAPAQLSTVFEGSLDRVALSDLVAEIAEGAFSGEAEVADLREEPAFTMRGDVRQLRLGRLLRTATQRFVWATLASGNLEVAASRAQGLTLSSQLTFEDPGDSTRPEMTGAADFTLDSPIPSIDVRAFEARAEGLEVAARGGLGHDGAASLDYDLGIASQHDLETLLIAVGSPDAGAFELEGPAQVGGQVSGPADASSWRELELQATVTTGAVRLGQHRLVGAQVDAFLVGDELTISRGSFDHAAGAVNFTGEASLGEGEDYRSWPLTVRASGAGLDLGVVSNLAGIDAEIAGALEFSGDMTGALGDPTIAARFTLTDWSFSGNEFDSARGDLRYSDGRAAVGSLQIQRGDALITGDASYDASQRAFVADFNGAGIRLRDTPAIGGGEAALSGLLAFDLAARGVLRGEGLNAGFESLDARGAWQAQSLNFGGVELGEWSGTAATAGETLELALTGAPLGGSVDGSATVSAATLAYSADVEFADLAIGALLAEGNGEPHGPSGSASGEARFAGNFGRLSETTGEGSFTNLELEIADVPGAEEGFVLYNPFPMRWTFAGGGLTLDHMRLQGEGTNVELTGVIGLAAEVDSDLRVEGDFNLAALRQFRSDVQASGRSTIQVQLTGAISDPEIQGQLAIRDGEIQPEDAPIGLSNMNGAVLFAGREFRIEEMRATSGGGALTLSGGGRLAAADYEFRLDGQAENVRVRYPRGITSVVDGDFILSGAGTRRLLSGEVTINRLSTARNATLGTLLGALRTRTPTAAQSAPSDSVQVNIHVASAPGVEINTSLIRNVAASIDLRIVGTPGNPSLLGEINIAQGQMTFHGSRYTINRGEIEFRNPVRIEPLLDFELETRMRGVDIALILAGPARRLNVSYRSDPPLSFSDLVNLVAVGRDPTTDPLSVSRQRVEQQSLFQTGANNVVAQAVQSPVSPGLQRFFGVSRLKVDPAVGGAEANPAARISTEQQLTDDITIIYTYDLSSSQQQTARLEWTPDRRWTFVLTRDENGLVGSDAIYKLRRP